MAHALAQDLDHILTHAGSILDALRGQNIFITGGTGFVGAWLVESFVWANERLNLNARAVLLTRNPDSFRTKALDAANHRSIQFLQGETDSFEFPEGEFPFVIHASTETYFEATREQPVSIFDRELNGTRHVLEFARTHGTRRFLFTSSGAIYGKQPVELTHIPEDYAGAPLSTDPSSAYSQAKRISEWQCMMYGSQYGFAALIARLFAFAGPHLALGANFAVGNFIQDVLGGGPLRIVGDGTPYRSYLYAADLAIWLWTILLEGAAARPYNVGSGDAVTIVELANIVIANTAPGRPIEIARKAVLGAPAARYVPSVERARTELGLRTIVPLDEAIRRMYRWNRALKGSLSAMP